MLFLRNTLIRKNLPYCSLAPTRSSHEALGPYTKVSVQAFRTWASVKADGVVGDQTWAVSLRVASATLETAVGLQFVIG